MRVLKVLPNFSIFIFLSLFGHLTQIVLSFDLLTQLLGKTPNLGDKIPELNNLLSPELLLKMKEFEEAHKRQQQKHQSSSSSNSNSQEIINPLQIERLLAQLKPVEGRFDPALLELFSGISKNNNNNNNNNNNDRFDNEEEEEDADDDENNNRNSPAPPTPIVPIPFTGANAIVTPNSIKPIFKPSEQIENYPVGHHSAIVSNPNSKIHSRSNSKSSTSSSTKKYPFYNGLNSGGSGSEKKYSSKYNEVAPSEMPQNHPGFDPNIRNHRLYEWKLGHNENFTTIDRDEDLMADEAFDELDSTAPWLPMNYPTAKTVIITKKMSKINSNSGPSSPSSGEPIRLREYLKKSSNENKKMDEQQFEFEDDENEKQVNFKPSQVDLVSTQSHTQPVFKPNQDFYTSTIRDENDEFSDVDNNNGNGNHHKLTAADNHKIYKYHMKRRNRHSRNKGLKRVRGEKMGSASHNNHNHNHHHHSHLHHNEMIEDQQQKVTMTTGSGPDNMLMQSTSPQSANNFPPNFYKIPRVRDKNSSPLIFGKQKAPKHVHIIYHSKPKKPIKYRHENLLYSSNIKDSSSLSSKPTQPTNSKGGIFTRPDKQLVYHPTESTGVIPHSSNRPYIPDVIYDHDIHHSGINPLMNPDTNKYSAGDEGGGDSDQVFYLKPSSSQHHQSYYYPEGTITPYDAGAYSGGGGGHIVNDHAGGFYVPSSTPDMLANSGGIQQYYIQGEGEDTPWFLNPVIVLGSLALLTALCAFVVPSFLSGYTGKVSTDKNDVIVGEGDFWEEIKGLYRDLVSIVRGETFRNRGNASPPTPTSNRKIKKQKLQHQPVTYGNVNDDDEEEEFESSSSSTSSSSSSSKRGIGQQQGSFELLSLNASKLAFGQQNYPFGDGDGRFHLNLTFNSSSDGNFGNNNWAKVPLLSQQ